MFKRLLASAALAGFLMSCTAAQVATATLDLATAQTAVASVCKDVLAANAMAAPLAAVPQVGAIMDYGTAACGTETAVAALVAKAMADPSTITWAETLATQIKAAVGK